MKILLSLLACLSCIKAFHVPTRRAALTLLRVASEVANPPETEASPEVEKEQFNWYKSWYPVVPEAYLDPEKPHAFKLFNMDIVIWKDASITGEFQSKKKRPKGAKRTGGQWRAFVDECPHRKVPLSEGRIEDDGSLLCSYHGYRFDGEGKLIAVPQAEDSELDKIKRNPKSNCNSFPLQIIDGVIWIWPETGDDARLESALSKAPSYSLPDSIDKERIWTGPWNFRELPYGADYFIENVVDPAHVGVSHHGIVGNRYNDQRLIVKNGKPLTKSGFSIATSINGGEVSGTTEFQAPCSVFIETPFGEDGAMQTLELYASPSRPGFCNHVGRIVIAKDKTGKVPPLLKQFTLPMPTWLNHVFAANFLNQDALFLHHQERYLDRTGLYSTLANDRKDSGKDYSSSILPVNSDNAVIKFRSWVKSIAGGRIPYKYNPQMPEANSEVVFDQWHSHTKNCQYCLGALKNTKKVRMAAFAIAVTLGVLRPLGKLGSLAAVFASSGIGLIANALVKRFYRYEFSHTTND